MTISTAPRIRRAAIALSVTAAAALLLSACAGATAPSGTKTADSSIAKVSNGASQVKATLTSDDECTLDATSAKAGPVTFTVTNTGSTAITEFELQSDQRILGEKENVVPGLAAVSFTVTLTGGKYQVVCPGAGTDTQTFTVTGKAASSGNETAQTALASGISGYRAYVTQEVNNMVDGVKTLNAAIDKGDLAGAQTAYAQARPYYERIESDVSGFVLDGFKATDNNGNLDYLIDMRESNLDPKVGWHGFHAIERDLFQAKKISDGTKKLATELVTNVTKLDELSKTLVFKPEDLANGASSLLEEVQSNKITGEEEKYSHIDLVDFAGNIEGAEQSFAYLKDGMKQIDPTLTATIDEQFAAVDKLLEGYRDPSALGGYASYTAEVKKADAPTLSKAVEALHESLARIAEKVATA